ncbi:MAG: M67 family metallopeptidase [Thaumarchaeota archaeon]|nr:M67 family metallopeptidase [Nitrososphaerota archaeon]
MTLQKEITLSKNHVDTLIRHAKQNEPNESCAILFGKNNNGQFSTTDVFLTKNTEPSPVNFTISNEDLIKAYKESEEKNLEVIAIFHSHPNSVAYPSSTDRQYMEVNPVPWIIYSNTNNEFRAYILESTIVPVNVTIL